LHSTSYQIIKLHLAGLQPVEVSYWCHVLTDDKFEGDSGERRNLLQIAKNHKSRENVRRK